LTVSLIAVPCPLLFMGDIVGACFANFRDSRCHYYRFRIRLLTSRRLMAAKLLRHQRKKTQSWFYRKSEHAF